MVLRAWVMCPRGAPAHAHEHAPRLGEGLHAALRGEHQREGEADRAQQHADGHQALGHQPAAQAVQRQQRRMHRAPAAQGAELLWQYFAKHRTASAGEASTASVPYR